MVVIPESVLFRGSFVGLWAIISFPLKTDDTMITDDTFVKCVEAEAFVLLSEQVSLTSDFLVQNTKKYTTTDSITNTLEVNQATSRRIWWDEIVWP